MNTQRLLHSKLPSIRIKSFSGSGVVYTLDRSDRTCTCLQFAADGHCKHLDEVGVYQPKQFTPRTHPTFSQALSGMVKSIRLSRVEDAIYFLVYLDQFPPNEKLSQKAARFRVARRILIGAAEDGMSISVMEEVAANFKFLCKLDTPGLPGGRDCPHHGNPKLVESGNERARLYPQQSDWLSSASAIPHGQ